jgi:DNA polymerase-3 subunit epsilon
MNTLRLWRFRRRARKLSQGAVNEAVEAYLQGVSDLRIGHLMDTPLVAVDLELTGLDARSDHIIAIGWTLIDGGRIQVGSNSHRLVQADKTVGSSAVIHGLVDSEVRGGGRLETALSELLEAAAGRVWVFHHAGLDTAFLNRACRLLFGRPLPFAVLDTLHIERSLRQRRDIPIQKSDLQLSALRRQYHLPRYTAHNALMDAYATAELLLAMTAHLSRAEPLKLRPWVQFV